MTQVKPINHPTSWNLEKTDQKKPRIRRLLNRNIKLNRLSK